MSTSKLQMAQFGLNANALNIQTPEGYYRLPVNDYCWENIFNQMDLITQNNFILAHPQFKTLRFNINQPLIIDNQIEISQQLLREFYKIKEASLNAGIFPIKKEYKKLKNITNLSITDIAIPLDFIKSNKITNLKIENSYHIFKKNNHLIEELSRRNIGLKEFRTKDNIYPIIRRSRNIKTLEYTNGRLDTNSLYHLMMNPIEKLKFHDVYIYWEIEFARTLLFLKKLTDLTLTGRLSETSQSALLKSYITPCRQRLIKLTIELFAELIPTYNVLIECINLKTITIIYRKLADLEDFYIHILNLPELKEIILKPNCNLKNKRKHMKILNHLINILEPKGITLDIKY